MPPIRAVLFDLDGVVRHFDPSYVEVIERRHGLEAGAVLTAAFAPEELELVTTGRMTRREWIDRVGLALGNTDAADEWGRHPARVDHEVTAIANDLRGAGIRTAILTNGTDTIPDEIAELGIGRHFEAVFNSAEIGWAKPDARAFQHVLDAMGLAPGEVFFTDDSPWKLAGAATLGMPVHHFTGADRLRVALRDIGVL